MTAIKFKVSQSNYFKGFSVFTKQVIVHQEDQNSLYNHLLGVTKKVSLGIELGKVKKIIFRKK